MRNALRSALPACLAIPLMVIAGALPIPGHVDQPAFGALAVLVAIGFAVAALSGFSLRGWLELLGGLLVGAAVSVVGIASFAETYTYAEWFVPRAAFIGGLSVVMAELIVAAGIGYLVGGLTVEPTRAEPGDRSLLRRLAVTAAAAVGSVLAAPALALGLSATVVSDDVLAQLNVEIADISILADGSLRISEPDTLRAGSNWYMLSNATDRRVELTMVPIRDEADLDRLAAGDQMGFTFMGFAGATAGQQPTLGRIRLATGRYAVYVDAPPAEIPEGGPDPASRQIRRSELVMIEVH